MCSGGKCEDLPVRFMDSLLARGHQRLDWLIFQYTSQEGMHPLAAYLKAKLEFATLEDQMCGEEKALHSYVYYGLPPSP